MKRIGLIILVLGSIFFVGSFTHAKDYEYTNLNITANILEDGTMNVKEDFTADFHISKHGIIRVIPLNYSVLGSKFHIDVSNIDVQGKNFTTSKANGEIEIKIGDADRTVIGEQSYPISYSTYGLIRNFSGMGYAELYWNLVGYDFDTNINNIHAEINLPKIYTGFTADDFLITTDGKSKTIDGFEGNIDWSLGDRIIINYNKGLPANQGITLAIKFPNDFFQFNHKKQKNLISVKIREIYQYLNSMDVYITFFIALLIFVLFLNIKSTKHQEGYTKYSNQKSAQQLRNTYPVIVQYNPPEGLNSAEVGLIMRCGVTARDMISLIYKRTAEGLISISTETEKTFFTKIDTIILTKLKEIPSDAPDYERSFFKSLIRGEKNKIKPSTNLYNKLPLSELEVYGKKMGRLYTKQTPNIWISIVIILFITSIITMLIKKTVRIGVGLFLFTIIVGICISVNERLRETEEGMKLKSHILGYKKFLQTCDENKLKLFLHQDSMYFDKILPYAVVFGLENKLFKKFEHIFKEMNIESPLYGNIDSIRTINHIISSSRKHSYSQSSYSSNRGFSRGSSFGGGFSRGGGGGGGGGRSW